MRCQAFFRSLKDDMKQQLPKFDRDEVLVCAVLAFCMAGASIELIYKLLG
jgi:hypothetical protein